MSYCLVCTNSYKRVAVIAQLELLTGLALIKRFSGPCKFSRRGINYPRGRWNDLGGGRFSRSAFRAACRMGPGPNHFCAGNVSTCLTRGQRHLQPHGGDVCLVSREWLCMRHIQNRSRVARKIIQFDFRPERCRKSVMRQLRVGGWRTKQHSKTSGEEQVTVSAPYPGKESKYRIITLDGGDVARVHHVMGRPLDGIDSQAEAGYGPSGRRTTETPGN